MELTESDFRDSLAWLRAVLTRDVDGVRVIAKTADPAHLVKALGLMALALEIDQDAPVA